jgi:hypothetical protein
MGLKIINVSDGYGTGSVPTFTEDLADNSVGADEIRLENNEPLRGRNFANSGDVNILKVGPDDGVELLTLPTYSGSNVATEDHVSTEIAAVPTANINVSTKTANYTVTNSDTHILCDATAGSFIITLPLSSTITREVVVKKMDVSSNTVTLNFTGGEDLDGDVGPVIDIQYQAVRLAPITSGYART